MEEDNNFDVYINNIFGVPIYIKCHMTNKDSDTLINFLDGIEWYPGDKLAIA